MFLHYIAIAGLALFILGWAVQYRYMRAGQDGLSREFAGLSAIGMILLVVDSIQNGLYDLALMYAATWVVSMAVFFSTKD